MLRVHSCHYTDEWPYAGTIEQQRIPRRRLFAVVAGAIIRARRSGTAAEIIDKVGGYPQIIDIVPLAGTGGGYFMPQHANASEVERHGASCCVVWYPQATFQYYVRGPLPGKASVTDNTGERWTQCAWTSELVLIHELGHAIQLIGDYNADGEAFMAAYTRDMLVIEHDNMTRHETPVAQELGYPPRQHYNHFRDSEWAGARDLH